MEGGGGGRREERGRGEKEWLTYWRRCRTTEVTVDDGVSKGSGLFIPAGGSVIDGGGTLWRMRWEWSQREGGREVAPLLLSFTR